MQDEDGQILEAHSISAGLDYPGTGPEHAWLRDSGPRPLRGDHRRAGARGVRARLARLEGIIPALESAHALAWALANGPSELDLVCLSGRGDKDLAEALELLGRDGACRIEARPASSGSPRRSRRPAPTAAARR